MAIAAAMAALAVPALAEQAAVTGPILTLQDALALSSTDQPRLAGYESEAEASEQAAVAARALPDPQVSAGIRNYPVTGDNALSPADAMMTMYTIGIMREQVRRSKREADARKILAEALVSRKQASAEERDIRRSVMLAWIDAVAARAKQALLDRMISDLRAGRKVMAAAIPTGGSTPALALQADAEIAIEQSQLEDSKRAQAHARADLARWIGSPAYRPLPDAIPNVQVAVDIVPRIDEHPQIQVALAQESVAERQVDTAREARKPDISWSVMAAIRPRYGEMLTGTVSIPLQLNRGNKQDRLIAEAQARANAARLRAEDARRELQAEYDTAAADYKGAQAELDRIDRDAVPALESAFKSAEARYAAGGGTLDQLFDIVRRYIESGIQSVDVEARRARAAAEILHVQGETHQ